MRASVEKYRLLGWLGFLLAIGFLATSAVSYFVSRDVIRENIIGQTLPLAGDKIEAGIQKSLQQPIAIASLMAHDTFLRDWALAGESDTTPVSRYLQEIMQRHGAIASFMVSERTRNYYHANGTLKTVQKGDALDKWYFRARDMKGPYEILVDRDAANRDAMIVIVNHRMFDYDGNVIGVTGVAFKVDSVAQLMADYRDRFQREAYFVDPKGRIVLASGTAAHSQGTIREVAGVRDIAEQILNSSAEPIRLVYRLDQATVLANSRFIPELGWHLVLEQDADVSDSALTKIVTLNLTVGLVITLLALTLAGFGIKHYQRRLDLVTNTDTLTGLLNRQAAEILFQHTMLDVARNGHPLSAILFDVDNFKRINDSCGYQAGDQILRQIAQMTRGAVRENDIIARWGGEEFLILLRDCPLQVACKVADNLRHTIEDYHYELESLHDPVTISIGVAEYALQESELSFFQRADKALHGAKLSGRNRIHVSPAQHVEESIAWSVAD